MKRIYTLITALMLTSACFSQSISEIYMPLFISVGTAGQKVPFACRVTINGLTANTTYRYINRMVASNAGATANGDGAAIFVKQSGDFVRSTSPSVASTASCGEFLTDASGSFTGWFANEASTTGFTVGNTKFLRIGLNNGANGTSVVTRITAPSPITVIDFTNTSSGGTGLRSTAVTGGTAKNFIMLFDDIAGGGRPVAGTFIESDGTANTATNGYADFYAGNVDAKDKTWGVMLPNNLATGLRRIGQYSLSSGVETGFKTSSDGNWPKEGGGRVSTINTTGGLGSVIVLDGSKARLDGADIKSDQTIVFNPLPVKAYGDPDFDPAATITSDLPVVYTSSNTGVATFINTNTIHIAAAGTADITASQPGDGFYNAATAITQTVTVNKAGLTITADNQLKAQGVPNPPLTLTYAGFVNGDDAADLNPQPTVTTTATTDSPTGDYPITVSDAGSANYTITYIQGLLTVNASTLPQTISFPALPNKIYGDVDFNPGATASSGLTITYTSSNTSTATIVNGKIHIAGTGSTTITASQRGSSAFDPAEDAHQTLTVTKAPLTITAENKTRLFQQPNPVLTVAYQGFVNGEQNTSLLNQAVITTTATISSPAGVYPITASGASSDNYEISYVDGALTIEALPAQQITFNSMPAKKYGDADFSPIASASSGLPVSYSSSNTQVAIIVNDKIQIRNAGTTIITASQAGDGFNAPAPDQVQTLIVQPARLTITANDQEKNEGEANPVFTVAYSGFVNGDDAADLATMPLIITTATTSSVTGIYPITVTGATSSNYTIAQLEGRLTVLPAGGAGQDNMYAYCNAPGQLRINVYAVNSGKAVIQVFDMHGTRLINTNVTLSQGHNTYQLQTGNLVAGIYHVRLSGNQTVLKNKVSIK